MKNLDTVYTDASCYESLMRFPTDVKLLWECTERAHKMMCAISSQLGEHRLRTKYNDIEKANLTYRKHQERTGQSESHRHGGGIRYSEGALRTSKDSCEDKIDRGHCLMVNASPADVFNAVGMCVAHLNDGGETSVYLPSGIYTVRMNGSSIKVAIK